MNKFYGFALLFIFIVILNVTEAIAFKLSPFNIYLNTQGYNSSNLIRVNNNSDKKIALTVDLRKRIVGINGKEDLSSRSTDITYFPKHLILNPYESKPIRIQWVGKKQLQSEEAYRLIVSQQPVHFVENINNGKKPIQFLITYEAAIYVLPSEKKQKIVISNYEIDQKNEKQTIVKLIFENKGTVHDFLKDYEIHLQTSSDLYRFDIQQFKELYGENILSTSKRKFTVQLPKIHQKITNAFLVKSNTKK